MAYRGPMGIPGPGSGRVWGMAYRGPMGIPGFRDWSGTVATCGWVYQGASLGSDWVSENRFFSDNKRGFQ